MSTNLTIHVNTSEDDIAKSESGSEFVQVDVDNDYLVFSHGSDVVADGESIPGESDLNQAGEVVSEDDDVIVSKYFLADISGGILKEIHTAGNQNKRYVFCFAFDGATASEPVLEVWDDSTLDSVDLYSLGNGTPSDSWFKGIVTTDGLPGADWVGKSLAGSSDNHFLWLNNEDGALTVAKDLYCNLKIIIPQATEQSGLEQPVLCCKYTTN